ncbi:hypothetical protein CAPTEDRAFT_229326 [Capitella teleta]|uniref:N-acetyltransferase domain-containing protein n=1 Tax=Capitella teleta TaxID=283909 RepID=R7VMF9_CAPTE|nr:hypothetical protein CAPTEDRAFT_229326 [Capitella teleta]|eukprot:ELU18770.1 hypothetical protein CAPTEDRAFT_229326 [Capitella teleta]
MSDRDAMTRPEVEVRLLQLEDAEEARHLVIQRVFVEGSWPMAMDNLMETRGLVVMTMSSLLTYTVTLSWILAALFGFAVLPLSYVMYIRYVDVYKHLNNACSDLTTGDGQFYRHWSSAADGRCMMVACLGSRLAGVAAVSRLSPKSVEVQRVAVHEEFSGRGIARRLMDELVVHCKTKGYDDMIIQVTSVNRRAEKIYKKYGFVDHTAIRFTGRVLNWTAIRLRLSLV